ncbi:hypothetical protein T10_8606 [Trichinella papuae]|uniref:Uncharacterized protein n=1 Tax=Trichinella papuae TaxID=268474 RepID=A0A0V1N7G1_9BILA|nr:hypothetical protein T10_8606 [Trichinella papuae]
MSSKADDLWTVSAILTIRRWDSSICSATIAQNNIQSTTVSLLKSEIEASDKAALWTDISTWIARFGILAMIETDQG